HAIGAAQLPVAQSVAEPIIVVALANRGRAVNGQARSFRALDAVELNGPGERVRESDGRGAVQREIELIAGASTRIRGQGQRLHSAVIEQAVRIERTVVVVEADFELLVA